MQLSLELLQSDATSEPLAEHSARRILELPAAGALKRGAIYRAHRGQMQRIQACHPQFGLHVQVIDAARDRLLGRCSRVPCGINRLVLFA